MSKSQLFALGLICLLVLGLLYVPKKVSISNPSPSPTAVSQLNPKTPQKPLHIGSTVIQAETRKTEAEQELGLSWRTSMGANEGMAFVYNFPQQVLYWMKGMQFPLDFIWVKQGKVIETSENVPAPLTENSKIYTISPQQQVDIVIEVNAGFVKTHGVKVGDEVTWGN